MTTEQEVHNELSFTEILVIRNVQPRLEIYIRRKESNMKKFIPPDFNYCNQYKISTIHFLVKRLVNLPLNKLKFQKESQFIILIF